MDIKKMKIVFILSIVMMFVSSIVSAMAVSAYLYNSNEVSYNNNASGINSTNVQGAIDELYEHATDYTNMNTRVSALEGYFKNNPTSYFDGRRLEVGINSSSNSVINLYKNGTKRLALWPNTGNEEVSIAAYSTDGTSNGGLNVSGNPIRLSGDVSVNSYNFSMHNNVTHIKRLSSSGETNTFTMTIPAANYRWVTGILITRYSVCSIHAFYDGASNLSAKVTTLSTTNNETFTVTVSGTTATFKSSQTWNTFTILLTGGSDNSSITYTTSKT